ncbi:efflux RND transporter periplasmic adaptor subunit [candidate division WOR-3 bacterium]|nr:efflux RND transporter periplasmic adaptor subunit [candidate division WOR-3 bacterium]
MKKIGWIVIIVIVGIIVFRIIQKFKTKETVKSIVEVPTEVVIEEVKRGDIAQTLSYTGNIVGKEQVNIYPIEETGRLIKYLVKEGDIIKKGQVIALVDRSIKGMEFKPAKITSPISGTVGMLFLDKGAMVSPQIPVATIAKLNKVKVKIQIPEKDLPKVHKGQSAVITVDIFPDKKFLGKLEGLSPFVNPMTKTSPGEIIVPNPGHLLKPGMFARVELIIEKHINTIVVPEKTVIQKNGKRVLFVVKEDCAEMREVETGIENEGSIEILKGLKIGEKVITLGNYGLRDGAKVKEQ